MASCRAGDRCADPRRGIQIGYLDEVLPHYPELSELHRFIEHKVKPAIERLQAVAQA